MINSVCGVKSTGRICTDLAAALEQEGHAVEIAYGRDTVPSDYQNLAYQIGNPVTIAAHLAYARMADAAGFGSRRDTLKLIEEIRRFAPDVIHLHNLHGYYLNVQLLFDYLKTFDGAVIWTLHDCWPFTGHCTHYAAAGCEQWKTQCLDCTELNRYPACFAFAGNVRNNYIRKRQCFCGVSRMTLVTPSRWLAGQLPLSFLKDYPVRVIPNGIDLTAFRHTESDFRQRNALENKKILLGVAGKWTQRKGFDDFLRMAPLLSDDERIVLVGVTEKQRKLLPSGIIGITAVDNLKTLAEIYSAADVFVNLTYEDTFPTVNLEALACGCPVVTYHTCGSAEALTDAVGTAVTTGDVQAAYEAAEKWIAAPPAAETLHAAAQQYHKKRSQKAYLNLYQECGGISES